MQKKLSSVLAASVIAAGGLVLGSGAVDAAAQTYPISGTKACYDSAWFISSNVRSMSSGNKTIKVTVGDAGTGGIKIRARRVNDNALTSTGYYPPLDTWRTLTTSWSAGQQFKFMFNCVNEGNTSSVWWGTASY